MQLQIDIQFDRLVALIRSLPNSQLTKLKAEIDQIENSFSKTSDLEEFLMSAPTFSENQIKTIEETRKAIDQWRKV